MTAVNRAKKRDRVAMSAVAAYEIVALWTDVPTITRLSHKYPVLAGIIVGGLAVHFQPKGSFSS